MGSIDAQAAKEGALTGRSLVTLQLEAHKTLLERADGTTRLAVALIGGITLITGYLLTTGLLDVVSSILILLSVLVALAGIFGSLRVSVGTLHRRILELGPNLRDVEKTIETGQTLTEAHLSLIYAYRQAFRENALTINSRSRLLVITSYLLTASTIHFLAALIYIVGGMIHG